MCGAIYILAPLFLLGLNAFQVKRDGFPQNSVKWMRFYLKQEYPLIKSGRAIITRRSPAAIWFACTLDFLFIYQQIEI